jgi:hypothetical protein
MKRIFGCVFLIAFHQSVFASGGFGFTAGLGLENWSDNENPETNTTYYDVDGRRRLGNYGIVIDSNLNKKRAFNYRFSGLWETSRPGSGKGFEYTGLSTTHDFGVGIVTNRDFRIWAGPRIYFGLSEDLDQKNAPSNTRTEGVVAGLGIGPVVGLNINALEVVTFSFTYAYQYRHYYGDFWVENASTGGLISKQDLDIDSRGSYLNASILFRFSKY